MTLNEACNVLYRYHKDNHSEAARSLGVSISYYHQVRHNQIVPSSKLADLIKARAEKIVQDEQAAKQPVIQPRRPIVHNYRRDRLSQTIKKSAAIVEECKVVEYFDDRRKHLENALAKEKMNNDCNEFLYNSRRITSSDADTARNELIHNAMDAMERS